MTVDTAGVLSDEDRAANVLHARSQAEPDCPPDCPDCVQEWKTLWAESAVEARALRDERDALLAKVERLQRAYDGAAQKADSHRRLLEKERAK